MSNGTGSVKFLGASFSGLLGIAFIVLKLTKHISWSWWWVTAPLWGPSALVLALAILFYVGVFLYYVIKNLLEKYTIRKGRSKNEKHVKQMKDALNRLGHKR